MGPWGCRKPDHLPPLVSRRQGRPDCPACPMSALRGLSCLPLKDQLDWVPDCTPWFWGVDHSARPASNNQIQLILLRWPGAPPKSLSQ